MNRRALIVDDEAMTAALVQALLTSAGFEVRLARSAAEASAAFDDFDPDVAIIDIALGRGPSGVDIAHIARDSYPATAILLLTRFPDRRTAIASAGELPPGCGFLSKANISDSEVLLDAVEDILSASAVGSMPKEADKGPLADLTRTQLAVLHMVSQGFTTVEIARRRQCTTNAVEKILGSIYQRLNVDTEAAIHPRVEAIRIYASVAPLPERPS